MCHLNHSCPIDDGSCTCYINQCLKYYRPSQIEPLRGYMDMQFAHPLMSMIMSQSEKIKELTSLLMLVAEKLTKSPIHSPSKTSLLNPSDEIITENYIIESLCGNALNFTYQLKICGEIPNPAYKERAFPLMVCVADNLNNEFKLPKRVLFKILLFTAEYPLKQLTLNTSGDKAVLGTLDADGDSSILFKKIIIKEVSSHFRNGSFFLVVKPENADNIRPLVISNLVVKARKMKVEELKKKLKIDEVQI
ncbi:hypothetical protein SteCoe_28549 [Stentor coeruleus]|uniref:Uncharacterized protein n=1 Tax=Stentor coeruleus TaxID=5963 RepID=A0A1R2B803_9CILI|nr:hypothetical protein SteCoe_28549 [Stentor coeruleus]